MTKLTHNETGAAARLSVVRDVIEDCFGISNNWSGRDTFRPPEIARNANSCIVYQDYEIHPVAYDPECPFKYNNFIYQLILPSSWGVDGLKTRKSHDIQPGCAGTPPIDKHHFILRLVNPDAEGMRMPNRVENMIAIMDLARSATSQAGMRVVPDVYAWAPSTSTSQGWILEQYVSGVTLDTLIATICTEEKSIILRDIVKILAALQKCELPDSVTQHGGVTYDPAGNIVSSVMATTSAGPWISVDAMYRDRLQLALKKADCNEHIKGWQAKGIRTRLDKLITDGFGRTIDEFGKDDRLSLVHSDLTTNNILYDPAQKRITALLDFDFACITHPSHEFLRSFDDHTGSRLAGYTGNDDNDEEELRHAKLTGSLPADKISNGSAAGDVDWENVRIWEEILGEFNLIRPSTVKGVQQVADLEALLDGILPFRLSNEDVLALQSEDTINRCRVEEEEKLDKVLQHMGY